MILAGVLALEVFEQERESNAESQTNHDPQWYGTCRRGASGSHCRRRFVQDRRGVEAAADAIDLHQEIGITAFQRRQASLERVQLVDPGKIASRNRLV